MKLHFFPASHPNTTGVLVIPGGGYGFVSMEKEGTEPAAWLNERGYDAWILEYTTATRDTPPPPPPPPPIYPVISMEPGTTARGVAGQPARRVSQATPPAFLFHTADDALVPVRRWPAHARPFGILVRTASVSRSGTRRRAGRRSSSLSRNNSARVRALST
ncbi:hypothetical protein F4775DRAFT_603406 [Biscogniauxia sp. FL1348]|nr:hypothetical protein F4775DRAFT_603406 [Biscogniauxia sp. FL1348]